MGQFSISKSVGKNCIGASTGDVMAVQHALKDKKQKTKFGMKPYYQGRIDGKAGPKTIAAIFCFQRDNKIPADGKVQTMGRTINALARGLSAPCLKDIAASQLGEKRTGAPNAAQMKAERAGQKSAHEIKTKSPLPKKEAEALAKLIQAVSKRSIALTTEETDITNDGRFTVLLKVDTAALPHNVPVPVAHDLALSTLKDESRLSAVWSMPYGNKLSVTSKTAYEELRNLKEPSAGYLAFLGVKGKSFNPAQKRLLAAAEILLREEANK